MWPRLLCLCAALLLTIPASVQARLIPFYRMESLAFLSEAVVLCEEQSVTTRPVGQASWHLTANRVRCRAEQAFKGELAPGAEFEVEYDPLYVRVLPGGEGTTYLNSKGKVERVVDPLILPPGHALLFLRQAAAGPLPWEVVSAKLIQGEQIYQFGQFRGNPGGLVLALQKPENISLPPTERYNPARLIEDLRVALQHAVMLGGGPCP